MHVVMTFVLPPAEGEAPPRLVFTGPRLPLDHASDVFALLELDLPLGEGMIPITKLREGLACARRTLNRWAPERRPKRAELTLMSLATWATVASIKGATALQWKEV